MEKLGIKTGFEKGKKEKEKGERGGKKVERKQWAFASNMNEKWKNIQKRVSNRAGKNRNRTYFKAENSAKSTNIIYIFEQNDKLFIFGQKDVAIYFL